MDHQKDLGFYSWDEKQLKDFEHWGDMVQLRCHQGHFGCV